MHPRTLAIFALFALAAFPLGCHHPRHAAPDWHTADLAPTRDPHSQPRALAFPSDQQQQLQRQAHTPASHQLTWYSDRKDAQLAVEHGVASPTIERVQTLTTDRQRIIRGRVRDDLHQRTHRFRVDEAIR